MARTYDCRFTRRVDAPVDVVWDVLSDHAGYASWTPLPTSRLVTPGDTDRNGVGAVRFLGLGPLGTTERVLVAEPNEHLAYTVVGGLPVKDYRADARLTDAGQATDLVYEGSFAPVVPGTGPILSLLVRGALGSLVSGLARESRRRASARAA
jgi:uncharacterized protein YndB with AHSA1/START domain